MFAGYFRADLVLRKPQPRLASLLSSLTESQSIRVLLDRVHIDRAVVHRLACPLAGAAPAGSVLNFIAFDSRLSGFARGLVDTRDVVFFLSVTATCLVVSFRALERRKWA